MQKPDTKYTLLTFYKFVDIDDPHAEVKQHKRFCEDIGIKGRIYIGEEGISATLTANTGQLQAYKMYLSNNPFFKDIPDIEEKSTIVEGHEFRKMIVRYRKEIVALGKQYKSEEILKAQKKLSVDDFKKVIDENDNSYVIIDMRNNYEYDLGHFKNAIPAGTVHFRDLDKMMDHYKSEFKDKKIVMYCTGGIRCEKAAPLFMEHGIKEIYQLDGGVVKYVNKYGDGNWLGNLYTFDGRVSAEVNPEDKHKVIGRCHYTGEPSEDFHNCRHAKCNAQFIAKPKEYRKHFGFCSLECAENAAVDLNIRDDDFDSFNYKEMRGLIKQDPTQKEKIAEMIKNHLVKNLANVEFKHKYRIQDKLMFCSLD